MVENEGGGGVQSEECLDGLGRQGGAGWGGWVGGVQGVAVAFIERQTGKGFCQKNLLRDASPPFNDDSALVGAALCGQNDI